MGTFVQHAPLRPKNYVWYSRDAINNLLQQSRRIFRSFSLKTLLHLKYQRRLSFCTISSNKTRTDIIALFSQIRSIMHGNVFPCPGSSPVSIIFQLPILDNSLFVYVTFILRSFFLPFFFFPFHLSLFSIAGHALDEQLLFWSFSFPKARSQRHTGSRDNAEWLGEGARKSPEDSFFSRVSTGGRAKKEPHSTPRIYPRPIDSRHRDKHPWTLLSVSANVPESRELSTRVRRGKLKLSLPFFNPARIGLSLSLVSSRFYHDLANVKFSSALLFLLSIFLLFYVQNRYSSAWLASIFGISYYAFHVRFGWSNVSSPKYLLQFDIRCSSSDSTIVTRYYYTRVQWYLAFEHFSF